MEEDSMERFSAQLDELVAGYRRTVEELDAARRPGDGWMGLGRDPKRDPCHMAFYQGVGKAVEELPGLTAEQAGEAAELLLTLGLRTPVPEGMLPMLEAAQGHALPLISQLPPERAALLLERYAARYPRKGGRLPIHTQLLQALNRRAGGKTKI